MKKILTVITINCLFALPAAAQPLSASGTSDTLSARISMPAPVFGAEFTANYKNLSSLERPDIDLADFCGFNSQLMRAGSEEEIFSLIRRYIIKLIGAPGVTIYTLTEKDGKIIYRNIWREGMEGQWKVVWKELPPQDEKAANIKKATFERPYLYIKNRSRSKDVHLPWLLKDVFMYRFGANSRISRTASRWIDVTCAKSDIPARIGLGLIKLLRPQWVSRVNESLHITILSRNNVPLAQVLVNNWINGKPLFKNEAEKEQQLKALTFVADLGALALENDRLKYSLEKKGISPEDFPVTFEKLQAIAHIYQEGVSRSIHSSKNYITSSIPGYTNLILKKLDKNGELFARISPLAKQFMQFEEKARVLEKFERKDIVAPLAELSEIIENPEKLTGESTISEKDIALLQNGSGLLDVWPMLVSLYLRAGNEKEINMIHEQVQSVLRDNAMLISREKILYQFIRELNDWRKIDRAQKLLDKNTVILNNFIKEYRPIYDKVRDLLKQAEAVIDELNNTAEAQEERNQKRFEAFKTIYSWPFIQINEEFFSLVNDLSPRNRTLDIRETDVSLLLKRYESPMELLANGIEKKLDIEYSFRYSVPEDLRAVTDATEFNLIMDNLFSNAVKYSDRGGEIEISARYDKKEINGKLRDVVAVSVSDQGRGIAPDKIHLVGQLHQRLGMESKSTIKGSGIGLSYVKKVLAKMGGAMEVSSPGEGQGSTFTIYLPKAPALDNSSAEQIIGETENAAAVRPAFKIEEEILVSKSI